MNDYKAKDRNRAIIRHFIGFMIQTDYKFDRNTISIFLNIEKLSTVV